MNKLTRAHVSNATIHSSVHTRAGLLTLRDAMLADASAYVDYWHYSGEKLKDLLGIDRQKLGTPEDSRNRFLQMIRLPEADQPNVLFTITLNDEVIGYTNINRYGPDENYVHLHTYRAAVRSALSRAPAGQAKLGSGLAAAMIGPIIALHLRLFPVRRLVLQTRTINRWINRALDLYLPAAETKYIMNPPGLAAPSECYVRYVGREDVAWMLQRAQFLANSVLPVRSTNRPQPDSDGVQPGTLV